MESVTARDVRAAKHSPSEHSVELLAAGRDLEHALSLLTKLMSSLEAAASRLGEASVMSCVREAARYSPGTW
jgi:hypothetical protein